MEKSNERKLKKLLAPDHRKVKKGMKKGLTRLLRHKSNSDLQVVEMCDYTNSKRFK